MLAGGAVPPNSTDALKAKSPKFAALTEAGNQYGPKRAERLVPVVTTRLQSLGRFPNVGKVQVFWRWQ
jgi:hypothetical protein